MKPPSDTDRLRSHLGTLNASLDVLDSSLEHLLAVPLNHTLLGLDTIQQAKLQSLIPYILYDLIFIYLKSKGVDPKSHAVVSELDRVRQYFDKITSAENSPQRRLALDKAAAGRFIKHALAQAQQHVTTTTTTQNPSTSTSEPIPPPPVTIPNQVTATDIPVKVTSKMLARAQYEQELKEAADEEEPDLQVWDSVPSPQQEGEQEILKKTVVNPMPQSSVETHLGTKRRRPTMDPFAGYGDDPADSSRANNAITISDTSHPTSGRSTPNTAKSTKKARKRSKR